MHELSISSVISTHVSAMLLARGVDGGDDDGDVGADIPPRPTPGLVAADTPDTPLITSGDVAFRPTNTGD